MSKLQLKFYRILVKSRFFLLGVGLSGLHYSGFIENTIFVIITAVSLVTIFEVKEWEQPSHNKEKSSAA
jgi:hypothetical protein